MLINNQMTTLIPSHDTETYYSAPDSQSGWRFLKKIVARVDSGPPKWNEQNFINDIIEIIIIN